MGRATFARLLIVPLFAALLAVGPGAIRAQPATPAAIAPPVWLVVQAFESATLRPDPSSGAFTLTLTGVDAAVLAFTDRPNRLVAYVPTVDFMEIVVAERDNPLNAALVSLVRDGVEAMAVVELLSAAHDAAAGTVTYGVAVLATEQGALAAGGATPPADLEAGLDLGPGHLFVDSLDGSDAHGEASGSPGVLSGNVVSTNAHIPIDICGNTIDVVGLLNPTFGNTCEDPAP